MFSSPLSSFSHLLLLCHLLFTLYLLSLVALWHFETFWANPSPLNISPNTVHSLLKVQPLVGLFPPELKKSASKQCQVNKNSQFNFIFSRILHPLLKSEPNSLWLGPFETHPGASKRRNLSCVPALAVCFHWNACMGGNSTVFGCLYCSRCFYLLCFM